MIYQHEVPVNGHCYLAFGEASWDGKTPVLKLGWRDRNGHRSRPGGEFWMEAHLQATTEAIKLGYIKPQDALQAIIDGMS